jgi:hypothetical protein
MFDARNSKLSDIPPLMRAVRQFRRPPLSTDRYALALLPQCSGTQQPWSSIQPEIQRIVAPREFFLLPTIDHSAPNATLQWPEGPWFHSPPLS